MPPDYVTKYIMAATASKCSRPSPYWLVIKHSVKKKESRSDFFYYFKEVVKKYEELLHSGNYAAHSWKKRNLETLIRNYKRMLVKDIIDFWHEEEVD